MIVEDDADVRTGLRYLLELRGHRVHEASDGPSGVAAVIREQADLALIDIGLPFLDGYGVARALRSRTRHKLRLVALTGYGSAEDMNRGMQAGFDDYLVKPVDPDCLHRILAAT